MSDFEEDELVLAELKSAGFNGLSERAKGAIKSLAQLGLGGCIYLFLSFNKRIRENKEEIDRLDRKLSEFDHLIGKLRGMK